MDRRLFHLYSYSIVGRSNLAPSDMAYRMRLNIKFINMMSRQRKLLLAHVNDSHGFHVIERLGVIGRKHDLWVISLAWDSGNVGSGRQTSPPSFDKGTKLLLIPAGSRHPAWC